MATEETVVRMSQLLTHWQQKHVLRHWTFAGVPSGTNATHAAGSVSVRTPALPYLPVDKHQYNRCGQQVHWMRHTATDQQTKLSDAHVAPFPSNRLQSSAQLHVSFDTCI